MYVEKSFMDTKKYHIPDIILILPVVNMLEICSAYCFLKMLHYNENRLYAQNYAFKRSISRILWYFFRPIWSWENLGTP